MTQAALTSGQYEALRGTSTVTPKYTGRVRVSTCPNDEIYRGRINQASFAAIGFAQFTFDGGVGTRANIKVGMRVLIARTNDITKAYFNGRVRADNSGVVSTSTTLNINETAADIDDNDYFWVIWDYQILDKLGREVSSVLKTDYELNFRQLLPIIYGLKSAYVATVNSGTGLATFSFAPSVLIATSGASASTWAWDVSDGTITVGSSSTQNITATFPEGFRWVTVTHTDSGSRVGYKRIPVWAHGSTFTPQLMTVENVNVTGNVDTGYDATLTNYEAVSGMLDSTLTVIWSDDSFQDGTTGSLLGDNILFVGRIRTSDDSVRSSEEYGREAGVQYTIEGALTQLAKTEQLPYEMINTASPTAFGQIKNLTIWRGCAYLLSEFSTFLELHSLSFDSTSDTYLAPTRNPSGNILAATNDLALSINAALQINAAGQAEIVRDGVMLEDTAARDALTVRANVTASDIRDITSYKHGHSRPTGQLTGSGGSYQTATDRYDTCESIAPIVRESGEGEGSLTRQVLPADYATTEGGAGAIILNQRAGHAFEKAQDPDEMQVLFIDSWHSVLIPSRNVWYTFTLDGTETTSGIVLTTATRWWLKEVSISHANDGTKDVSGTFIKETLGAPGQTITYPPSTGVTPLQPWYPPVSGLPMFQVPPLQIPDAPTTPVTAFPPTGTFTIPRDGNMWVVAGDKSGVQSIKLTTTMLLLAAPYTRELVPSLGSDEEIKQVLFNPYNTGIYCLAYDTVADTSRIWYAPAVTDYPMLWTAGATTPGEYSEMRLGNANGQVTILGLVSTTSTDPSQWQIAYGGTMGVEISRGISGGFPFVEVQAVLDLGEFGGYGFMLVTTGDSICCQVTSSTVSSGTVNGPAVWRLCGESVPPYLDPGGWVHSSGLGLPALTDLRGVGLTSTLPFTAKVFFDTGCSTTTAYMTTYSSDYGATLSTPEAVGVSATWIDTQKDGTQILVGTGTQTVKSSAGGAYSNYGSAKSSAAGFIPRYLLPPGTTSNSSSNPQSVIFASALDSGASMWMSKSSNSAFTDITPVSGGVKGLSVNSRNITGHWQNSSIILAIGIYTATVKLAVTTDGGTNWRFSAALNASAFNIVTQRGDRTQKLAGWINGTTVAICRNLQATTPAIVTKTFDLTTIVSLDVFG